jgi:predicted ATPase/class 3 adenylate cyclase/DNA-binding CsgD family transcriptional regulator/Tfp pilus assembly protein PilF
MSDRIGQSLGHYQLIKMLGQGRWAAVYLGEHLHLHIQAAIKVLHEPLASGDEEGFLGEARTLARLRHRHIVRVLDFGVQARTSFLVLEYAPGGSLRTHHPKGTHLPLDTVVAYVKQMAEALQYAHEQHVIHCDLKPENLLLGPDQEIWLSDFGLALLIQSARAQPFHHSAGTLAYMAPEQLEGHPTAASDQYALGVLVYEWLIGSRPFSGSLHEVMAQQALASPPALSEQMPSLPARVQSVVRQALAKDPAQRFACVRDFALALEEASREVPSGQTLPVFSWVYSAKAGPGAASLPQLLRGTVTLLFGDIEGPTHLLQQSDEHTSQVLLECQRLLRAAFQQFHGHEVDTQQGDAFLVVFARASDAVAAATAAQRALARYDWAEGVTVRVHMGLHTGEPALSSHGYVGLDVQHAACIMRAAHGGQILLSQTTRDLVEQDLPEGVNLRDLGEHRLTDLQRPTPLFQVVIAGLPADFPPPLTLNAHPNNLPIQPTPLVGRERELAAVEHLVQREDVHLVTLTGPGGVGKTRLGLQVAADLSNRFADGVFFVNLSPLFDPTLVVPTIAQTLAIQEAAGQPLLARLAERLQPQHVLLLLDNFEQVLSAAVQVAELLATCPQLTILVTSRERLHVRAEHEFVVPPLTLPGPSHLPDLAALAQSGAVALFLERADAIRPDFQLTPANAGTIAEICTRLDGLPLAIELAAARIKLLSPQALLARLGSRLALLSSRTQDVPARHQTLRQTIAWSCSLLTEEDQRLFRRLSVFVGGCTPEAVEFVSAAVGDTDRDVLEGIASLVDKSLLQGAEPENAEPRFGMLETIREYGLEVLAERGEAHTTHTAHAAYYLALAEQAEPHLGGPQQSSWFERLEREHDNLRAALSWFLEPGEPERSHEPALRLGGALAWFWIIRGYVSEGRHWLEQALSISRGERSAARAKALAGAGRLATMHNDYGQAEGLCEESLALYRELGDRRGCATALACLGQAAVVRDDYAAAHARLEEALALVRAVGQPAGGAFLLHALASVLFYQGEYKHAQVLLEESLELSKVAGNVMDAVRSLALLGYVLLSQGDLAQAQARLEESLAISREVGYKRNIGLSLHFLGLVTFQQGDVARARSLLEESLVLLKEVGEQGWMTEVIFSLGSIAWCQRDVAAARSLMEESLKTALELNNRWDTAGYLEGLAAVVAAQGEPVRAVWCMSIAQALRKAIGAPLPPLFQGLHESALASVRMQLEERVFDAAWEEGRTMTPEHALSAQEAVTMPATASGVPSKAPQGSTPPASPDGLTAREVEVLRLVAQGLTNEQVAAQLVISPRTVNTHLTSIFSKVGVSTRAAATRYAIEHHLA